ncbi:hypothetical protein Slala03_71450 [Streptomyces lavendulae subsp. lavendulae]|uniref:hypothetical protein n=1 Tax=Streptomyces lavendulae TaxID=1914 RepID=UPI0024A5D896|nr:hypothetical protein [Streptomyces lavendulae]GLV87456.1 hypothetical protein Slala03_71450 [Streptomyces lavendulae subsp. lavendulae]
MAAFDAEFERAYEGMREIVGQRWLSESLPPEQALPAKGVFAAMAERCRAAYDRLAAVAQPPVRVLLLPPTGFPDHWPGRSEALVPPPTGPHPQWSMAVTQGGSGIGPGYGALRGEHGMNGLDVLGYQVLVSLNPGDGIDVSKDNRRGTYLVHNGTYGRVVGFFHRGGSGNGWLEREVEVPPRTIITEAGSLYRARKYRYVERTTFATHP